MSAEDDESRNEKLMILAMQEARRDATDSDCTLDEKRGNNAGSHTTNHHYHNQINKTTISIA